MPKSKTPRYATFIHKVLKQVHPDMGINGDALAEMNRLVLLFLYELVRVADAINRSFAKPMATFSGRITVGAVKLGLTKELTKHAISEGTRAVTRYNDGKESDIELSVYRREQIRKRPRRESAPRTNKAFRAGIQFPPARIEEDVRERMSSFKRLEEQTPIFLAAVMEYLTAEILELAGNNARDSNKLRIRVRDIYLTLRNDEALNELTSKMKIVVPGGVVPYIHKSLLNKPKTT